MEINPYRPHTIINQVLFQVSEHETCNAVEEVETGVSTGYTVVAVRVYLHFKRNVLLYQCLAVFSRVAEMHIVIGQAVAKQQAAV